LICLAGPTASGKTGIALDLASEWPLEVISVDSALVYRGMDIGTAKPSPEEQMRVRHHLMDIVTPEEVYSVARFLDDAQKAIDDVCRRGKLPLLVGGTMMYYQALLFGLDNLPASDPDIRAELVNETRCLGIEAMHARLAACDPVTARRLHSTDTQRVLRGLEVFMLTGKPLSDLQTGRTGLPRYTNCFISLEPSARDWLHTRIERRFDQMIGSGFIEEVRSLGEQYELHQDMPSMRAVGYRQARALLEGRVSFDEMRAQALAATRQLAKRQLTWLRKWPQKHSLACDQKTVGRQVGVFLSHWLENSAG
jgi:tRNA dimethylallyltransferase